MLARQREATKDMKGSAAVPQIETGHCRVVTSLIKVQTEEREELRNLTESVREFVKMSGVLAGTVSISSLHTTNAIFINEWQDALLHDAKAYLVRAVARDSYYRHNDPAWSDCDRHNADSHLRSMLLGVSLTLQIADGNVVLGRWQNIIMAEFDGPQERTVRLQAMGIIE